MYAFHFCNIQVHQNRVHQVLFRDYNLDRHHKPKLPEYIDDWDTGNYSVDMCVESRSMNFRPNCRHNHCLHLHKNNRINKL